MKWPFGKKKTAEPRVIPKEIPRDGDRRGPAPPPPPTAQAPGVEVFRFDAIPSPYLFRLGEGNAGFLLEGEESRGGGRALLALEGCGADPVGPGDVLVWTAPAPRSALPSTGPRDHVRRDGVAGAAFPGITGLRVLARFPAAGLAVLRLGPPPGARWVFRGVRAFAVFSGRLAVFDGDAVTVVRAGALARVGDPSATLYLEAGNDAALAVALAADDFVAALG